MASARHLQSTSERHNRKARRAASTASAPTDITVPTPITVTPPASPAVGSGYARYVGRVGALAVALGLGAAVASGYGIGSPAVAWAEDGETSENTSTEPTGQTDPTGTPDDLQVGSEIDNGPGPVNEAGPKVPEMQLSVSGTAQVNGEGEKTGNGIGEGATQEPSIPTQDAMPIQTVIPSIPSTPTQSSTPSTPQVAPTTTAPDSPASIQPPAAQSDVAPTGTDITTTLDPNGNQVGQEGKDLDGGLSNRSTIMMNALTVDVPAADSPQLLIAAAAAAGTPAPAPLVDHPNNAVEALIGTPIALANIAITAVSTFLSSILSPGPTTPAPPVMLFVVLGWVQREVQRTFFNQSPTGVADPVTTSEDVPVTIPVLANDTDGDLGAGDVLTVTDYTQPTHGTVVLNPNGTFTYTPTANYNGTDTFTYTVSDEASPWHVHGLAGFFSGGGHTSATTVTIAVGAVNDAPVAVDDAFTTNEDTPFTTGNVLAGDSDPDGNPLHAVLENKPTAEGGTVVINNNGTFVYTPRADFTGPDTFTYTVKDGSGAANNSATGTVTITVTPVNDAPVAVDDTAPVAEDGEKFGNVLINDTDVDNTNNTLLIPNPGVFTHPQTGGQFTLQGDGNYVYRPATDFNGTETFTYTVSDPGGLNDTGTITFTVGAINDAPVAVDDTAATNEDNPVTGNVLENDDDVDGDPLAVTATTMTGTYGTLTIGADGAYTYTPGQGGTGLVAGAEGIEFTITDSATVTQGTADFFDSGDQRNYVAITFTAGDTGTYVFGQNEIPLDTIMLVYSGTFDPTSPNLDYLAVDDDSGEGLEPQVVVGLVEGQTYTVIVSTFSTNVPLALPLNLYTDGPGVFGTDGVIDPNTLAAGEVVTDTFSYEVSDGNGGSDTATVVVTITGSNDALVAVDDADTDAEDTPQFGNVLDNDTDIDGDPLVIPTGSTGVFTHPTTGGTFTLQGDGSYRYDPVANFNGTETFTYTVSDGNGATDTGLITFTVNAVDDPTVAGDDTATIGEDSGTTTINVLANDSDPDGPLTIIGVSQPSGGGSVVVDPGGNSVSFTPSLNSTGIRTFTYTVTQGGVNTTRIVTVTITPVDDAPVLTVTPTSASGSNPATFTASATDPDSAVTFDVTTQPLRGTVQKIGTNVFTYTPDPALFNGQPGTDTFVITASDGQPGGTDSQTISYNYSPSPTITLSGNAQDIASSSDSTRTYAILDSNRVQVIDTGGFAPVSIGTVNVGAAPTSIAVSGDGTRAYVTSTGSNTVTIIDTSTSIITVTVVNVGASPVSVAVSDDGTRAFVAHSGTTSVTMIDAGIGATPNVITTSILVGGTQSDVAISADGKRAFVSRSGGVVTLIDTSTVSPVTTNFTVGGSPREIKVSDDGTVAIVYMGGALGVSIIKTTAPAASAVTNFTGISSYTTSGFIAISDDGTRAFVTQHSSSNSLGVIDTTQSTPTLTWINVPDSHHSVSTNADGSKAYVVSHAQGVYVVDTAAGTFALFSAVGNNNASDYEAVVASDDGTRLVMVNLGNSLTVRTFTATVV